MSDVASVIGWALQQRAGQSICNLVLIHLAHDAALWNGVATLSQQQLAEAAQVSVSSIRRAMGRLEEKGFIAPLGRGVHRRDVISYRLVIERPSRAPHQPPQS